MKKRYRRLLCVMLASVMALAGTGCSSGQKEGETASQAPASQEDNPASGEENSQEAEPAEEIGGTIEVWSELTQEERANKLQELADEYMASHPGTTVNITVMPWSGALDKMVSAIMAGNAPDIMVIGTGYPQTLAGTGGLLELTDLVEEIGGKDGFISTSLSVQGAAEDGGLYSIPLYITPYVAYYRQSWLDEAGITQLPATWEEYYEMCKAVTDPSRDRYGFALPLGDLHGWKTIWSFLQGNGVDLINVDDQGNWYVDLDDTDRAAMIETYDYLYKLVKDCAPEGTISYTQTNVREMVAGGTVMSRIDTPEIYYTLQSVAPDDIDDVSYFKIPGRIQEGSGQGWVGLSLSADGNTALAKDFIQYMYEGDRLVDFYLSYPYAMFPVRPDYFDNQEYQENLPETLQKMVPDMALEILSESTSLGMVNGPFPGAGEFESQCILGNGLIRMLTDSYTAEEAVDYIVEELEKLL